MTPLCTRMYTHPFFEATPPGAAPGPPVNTGARVRHFRGCNQCKVQTGNAGGAQAAMITIIMGARECPSTYMPPFLYPGCYYTPGSGEHGNPVFNRGSGGGARGCGFEERVGVYARTEGGHFL